MIAKKRKRHTMPYMKASTTYYEFWIEHRMDPPKRFPEWLAFKTNDEIRQTVQQLSGPYGKAMMHAYAMKKGLL